VLVDESVGWMREEYFGVSGEARQSERERGEEDEDEDEVLIRKRVSWRRGSVRPEDGAVAGGLLGAGVGIGCAPMHSGTSGRS